MERHDDVFEFQCSVYDLYNRGGDIDQHEYIDNYYRPGDNYYEARHYYHVADYLKPFVNDIRSRLNDDDRARLDDILALDFGADDVSG